LREHRGSEAVGRSIEAAGREAIWSWSRDQNLRFRVSVSGVRSRSRSRTNCLSLVTRGLVSINWNAFYGRIHRPVNVVLTELSVSGKNKNGPFFETLATTVTKRQSRSRVSVSWVQVSLPSLTIINRK